MQSKLVRIVLVAGLVALAAFLTLQYLDHQEEAAARAEAVRVAREALRDADEGPTAAMGPALDGLERFPDDPDLHLVRAIALIARGRMTDAEEALLTAGGQTQDPALRDEIDFHLARARALRYLDAGDAGDLNLASGPLETFRTDPRFGASATLLLGMLRARGGKDPGAAKALIDEGLRGRLTPEAEADAERGRAALRALQDA